MIGRGTIRRGASVWMDFSAWMWPDVPHGDADIVFEFRGCGQDESRADATAANFGCREIYGNGSLYVNLSDIAWLGIPDHVFVGEAI